MLEALTRVPGGPKVLPFVRLFYGQPSQYMWEDDEGVVHRIRQGEEGEQGDSLMPLLFSLRQHAALDAVKARMVEGEVLLAFLGDVYVIIKRDRVGDVYLALQEELYRHARIRIHAGKTQVWNAAGERPEACDILERIAQAENPGARVWKGSNIPTAEQGVRVLGNPLGHLDYVQTQLTQKLAEHDVLLQRIPLVTDVQSAWSLLLHCAGGRANYLLRVVRPELVGRFALGPNEGLWECFKRIMKLEGDVSDTVKDITSLFFALGGLGLRSATRTSESAFWASWADSFAMIRERHPPWLLQSWKVWNGVWTCHQRWPQLRVLATTSLVSKVLSHHPGKPWFKEPARLNVNRMILNQEEQGLDGNTKRRQGQNCGSEAASWPLWPSPSRPCSGHRVDLLLEHPSQLPRPPGSPKWIPTFSECSSPGGSVSHSLSLHACVEPVSMRPFLGRLWPPSRCVFESGGPGTAGVFSGKCGSAHLQRRRGQSDNQSLGPRYGSQAAQRH